MTRLNFLFYINKQSYYTNWRLEHRRMGSKFCFMIIIAFKLKLNRISWNKDSLSLSVSKYVSYNIQQHVIFMLRKNPSLKLDPSILLSADNNNNNFSQQTNKQTNSFNQMNLFSNFSFLIAKFVCDVIKSKQKELKNVKPIKHNSFNWMNKH